MRKLAVVSLVTLFLLLYCGPKQEKIERYIEDGVEIIVNHLEPYKIEGEPANLILEEEFVIDSERDSLAEIGLTNIGSFDVDIEGNIYIVNLRNKESLIFKFDRNGNFINSFLRRGQGPGEAHLPHFVRINILHEIAVTDPATKALIYNKEGAQIKEIILDSSILEVMPLESGDYLVKKRQILREGKYQSQVFLCLFNSKFEEIKKIDGYKIINEYKLDRVQMPRNFVNWRISRGKIYFGNTERGYEFCIYDLEGNLIRKIRKEYKSVELSDEVKKSWKKAETMPNWAYYGRKIHFSKYYPPFQYFFTDDERRLFVMTYEKGKSPGEYLYDIFNADGVFIGRTSLGNYRSSGEYDEIYATAKNNLLYCLREKESGYKELVVYKMRWE